MHIQNPVFVHFWLYFQSCNKKKSQYTWRMMGKKMSLVDGLILCKICTLSTIYFTMKTKKINDFLVNSSILFQVMLLWLEFNNNKNEIESTHAYLLTAWALRWSSHPGFWKNLFCHSTVFAINTVKFFIVIKHLT